MRIMHIATLVTPDGAYGGPVRVAVNQLEELQRRGHEVELVAGARGYDGDFPTSLQGVPVSLFPVRQAIPGVGYAGLSSPGLRRYVASGVGSRDVVHVHAARDFVTMPSAAVASRSRVRLVVQPHGMIDQTRNLLAPAFDARYTKRVLRAADHILALTELEQDSLVAIGAPTNSISLIANGVPTFAGSCEPSHPPEVLFLARLHPRKRAPLFVEMARTLLAEGIDARFSLVGPDEGDGPVVTDLIQRHQLGDRVVWEGSLPPQETLPRLARSSIYVLPSLGEVVSMAILEAMSVQKPIVITTNNGLAEPLRSADAGAVVNDSVEQLVDAVRSLLTDITLRERLGRNARALAERDYTIRAVVDKLERIYV